MVRMFVRHPVRDYAAWRKAYDDFDAERSTHGVTADAVFQSVDDPNDVTLFHDFGTRQEAEAFMASERLKRAMQEAGVAGPPTVWFVTET